MTLKANTLFPACPHLGVKFPEGTAGKVGDPVVVRVTL